MKPTTNIHRHDCPFRSDYTCSLSIDMEDLVDCYVYVNPSELSTPGDHLVEKDCPLRKIRITFEVINNRVVRKVVKKGQK